MKVITFLETTVGKMKLLIINLNNNSAIRLLNNQESSLALMKHHRGNLMFVIWKNSNDDKRNTYV